MITAKDINTRRFEQAKPGYKPEEVDEFLKEIADQINAMLKDKEDTEKKIEVLVESIRRYKADEEAWAPQLSVLREKRLSLKRCRTLLSTSSPVCSQCTNLTWSLSQHFPKTMSLSRKRLPHLRPSLPRQRTWKLQELSTPLPFNK